jgi:hypothetical protein
MILEKKEFRSEFLDTHKKLRPSVSLTQSPLLLSSPIFSTPDYHMPHGSFENKENDEDEPPPQDFKHPISHSHTPSPDSRVNPTSGTAMASRQKRSSTVPVSTGLGQKISAGPTIVSAGTRRSTLPILNGSGTSSSVAGDRGQTMGRNLSVPKDPALKNMVYRVQGLPTDCRNIVKDLLRSLLKLEAIITIEIRSLSISHDPHTLVATILLGSTPPCLFSSSDPPKDEWRFSCDIPSHISHHDTEEGPRSRQCEITFDTHFIGLTILWSPKNSEDHKVE